MGPSGPARREPGVALFNSALCLQRDMLDDNQMPALRFVASSSSAVFPDSCQKDCPTMNWITEFRAPSQQLFPHITFPVSLEIVGLNPVLVAIGIRLATLLNSNYPPGLPSRFGGLSPIMAGAKCTRSTSESPCRRDKYPPLIAQGWRRLAGALGGSPFPLCY